MPMHSQSFRGRSLLMGGSDLGKLKIATLSVAIFALISLVAVMSLPPFTSLLGEHTSMLSVHLLMELFAIIIAMLVVVVSWHTFEMEEMRSANILICGFMIVAACDILHALTYKGMPALLAESSTPRAIFFWLMGRSFEVLTMFLIALEWAPRLSRKLWLGIGVVISSLLIWFGSYQIDIFPTTFVQGVGVTEFKAVYEYLLCALNLVVAFLFWRKAEQSLAPRYYWLALSSFLMGIGEIAFTAYVAPSDFQNIFGHSYKLAAYALIYRATFVTSLRAPYEALIKSRAALNESETYTRTLFDSSPIGLVLAEMDGTIVDINPACARIIGCTIEEAKMLNFWEITPASYADQEQAQLRLLSAAGRYGPYEKEVIHKNGQLVPVRLSGLIVTRRNEQFIWSSVEDITTRKNSEKTLNDALATLDATDDANFIFDPDTLQFTYVNEGAVKQLGYTREALLGMTPLDIKPEYDESRYRELLLSISGEKNMVRFETIHRRKDGIDIPVEITLQRIKLADQSVRFVNVARNISERKQKDKEFFDLREQLSQASKMESIGHLTAGIAHDFNNMLGAMMGYSELSQHMLAAGKPEPVYSFQEEILKSGNRAKVLIRQMLTFSRLSPEANKQNSAVIILASVLKEVVSLVRPTIPATISISFNIDDENLKARIQPVNLHQILLNLIVNARDAIGEYGTINIVLSKQHYDKKLCSSCRETITGEYAQITVQDSGGGIQENILSKIFDPFFTTKGVGQGTGMGLSVIHGLVHTHGGHVYVESNPGVGSKFNIILPLGLNEESAVEVNNYPLQSNIKGIRIMVVDDEAVLANMLKEFLTACGAEVTIFTDPGKALDRFNAAADQIDIVITDETMPGISGMLLSEKLLKVKPSLPIILCTGFSDHATPEAAAQIGIAGFFNKPVNMNDLMQKVNALCKL